MDSNLHFWPNLPEEITKDIIFYVDAKSLLSMTKVCKQWQQSLWRTIRRFKQVGEKSRGKPYRGSSFGSFIKSTLSRLEHSKMLEIVLPSSFINNAYETINVVDDNLDMLAKMTNLRSFSIPANPYCVPVELMNLLTKFTHLTSLHIPFNLGEKHASHLTKLSKLEILHFHHSHLDMMRWVSKLPQLGTLHLETLPYYSGSLEDCTQLTSLTLRSVDERRLPHLVCLTQLKELYLQNVYDPCLAQLTNVTKLGIGRFPSWDGNDDLPPHIKSLSVEEIGKNTLQSFTCLNELYTLEFLLEMGSIGRLTQLHTLVLCHNISNISLSQLTNLTRLGIEDWNYPLNSSSYSIFSSLTRLRVWEYSSSSSDITPSQIATVFPIDHVLIRRRKFYSLHWTSPDIPIE